MSLMTCKDACEVVAGVSEGDVVVITMSTMKVFPNIAPTDALYVTSVPLMGGAASIGLGIAIARPDITVWVMDGDASLLMELGGLVTVSEAMPTNLVHILCDNRVQYGGTANMRMPRNGEVDFCGMAQAAGYPQTLVANTKDEFTEIVSKLPKDSGPTFIRARIEPDAPYYNEETPQREIPESQITRMGDEGRRVRAILAQRTV